MNATRSTYRCLAATAVLAAVTALRPAQAQRSAFDPVRNVGWTQRMDAQVPPAATFRDETGKTVKLGDFFGSRPVVLNMIFYRCPGVCTMELDGMVRAFSKLSFDPGNEFEVITVSIDPKEGPALAASKKEAYMSLYRRPSAQGGWHFLVGNEAQIEKLASAIGFRYTYDERTDRISHPAGIVVLTPEGKVSRYFLTTQFAPKDLRLALVEASNDRIGSPVDRFVLLTCLYHYDAHTGKYGIYVFRAVQMGGFLTVFVVGGFMTVMFLRDRRNPNSLPAQPEPMEPAAAPAAEA